MELSRSLDEAEMKPRRSGDEAEMKRRRSDEVMEPVDLYKRYFGNGKRMERRMEGGKGKGMRIV
jgi:hypothetical protein